MASSTDCQFCSNLMDKVRSLSWGSPPWDNKYDELGNLSDIIEMPCSHAGSIRRAWEAHALEPENRVLGLEGLYWGLAAKISHDMTLLLVFKVYKPKVIDHYFTSRTRLILRPDEPGHAGTTWVLNSQWADLSIMRTWVKRCREEHGEKCEHPDWMTLRTEPITMPEWLVDVVDYCIVEYNADTAPYIALSYTWGGVQCLKHTNQNVEQLKAKGSLQPHKASNVPRTVRDAFEITKLLGERYLWVDSLCIPQGGATATRGLNSMHHIYANSIVCLIAFAGTDANHGLRGIQEVSAPRHAEQVIHNMANGERLSSIPDSCKSIRYRQPDAFEGSRYNQRGWTYQEYLFAKRRLIFTDGLLHWTCQCADWSEETHGNLNIGLPWDLAASSKFWMTSTGPNLILVETAAIDFNTRYFTHEEDVLKAFLGIQNHISRDFLGGFNYGHPQIFFDISLVWGLTSVTDSKRRLGGIPNSDPPSWSWMGWQGDFYFYRDEEYCRTPFENGSNDGFTQSVAQWYTMQNSLVPVLDLQPVNCQWQIHRAAVKRSSDYVLSGWRKVRYNRKARYYPHHSEYCFRRESADEGTNNDDHFTSPYKGDPEWEPTDFEYPIPLPAYTRMGKSNAQRPLLYTRTTRCFFIAKPPKPQPGLPSDGPPDLDDPCELFCHDGECAGLLWFHDELDELQFQLEVVAVVKGWTTKLSNYLQKSQKREDPVSPEWSPRYYYSEYGVPHTVHSCFFVLCVKWENGIAKRQGIGMVEASIWERNQEPVELILG